MMARLKRRVVTALPVFASARIVTLAIALGMVAPVLTQTVLAPPARAQTVAELATGAMANFTILPERKPVPETSFMAGDGSVRSLNDFKGKLVLLNLWATWCGPCRVEMPDLDALQAELGSDGFEVLALSSDRQGIDVVAPFYEEIGVEALAHYNDKTMKVQRAFRAFGLPTTVLIDPQGREIGRLVGPADWGSEEAVRLIRHYIKTESERS